MDLIALLIDFILGVFVLVALGQLFSINTSLKRLVQLAERAPAPYASTAPPLASNTPATVGQRPYGEVEGNRRCRSSGRTKVTRILHGLV